MAYRDREAFWATLEETGETEVRTNLRYGQYGNDKKPLVEEWLLFKDRGRLDAAIAEQVAIAKRATDAAERSAAAAEMANDNAKTARRIAIGAVIVSAIGALVASTS